MANLEPPFYKTLIPNEVFWKIAKPIIDPDIGEISAKEIVRIMKYRIPTNEESIAFIRKNAKSINIEIPMGDENFESESKVIYCLKNLPHFEVKNIVDGNLDSINRLRKYLPEENLPQGNTYFSIINGIVPNYVLNSLEGAISENDAEVYEEAIIKNGMEQWIFKIGPLENEGLPRNLKVPVAKEIIANQIRDICNALNSYEMVRKVRDISNLILRNCSFLAVSGVVQEIKNINIVNKRIGMVMDSIYGKMEEEKEEEFPKKSLRNLDFYIDSKI